MFNIKLVANNTQYKSSADTVYDALGALPLDYTEIKTKGEITVSAGKKSYTQFYHFKQLQRMFVNKTRRMGFARNLEELLETKGNKTTTPMNE